MGVYGCVASVWLVGLLLFSSVPSGRTDGEELTNIDMRGFSTSAQLTQTYFTEQCGQSSKNRFSRECEFFPGIPEDQTFVCSSIEHCCFMATRCFGYLFASAVNMTTSPPYDPIAKGVMTTSARDNYHNSCPYAKCNQGYDFARICKGNPDGGYTGEGGMYVLDPYNAGNGDYPPPCDQPGTCEQFLPYTQTLLFHTPYRNLGDCFRGLHNSNGGGNGNTRNCMRRFQEAHRRCLKFAIAFVQGNSTDLL